MKRWNIKKVILYSRNDSKKELEFDLEAVNIITGRPHSGKSAIIEVVDYCLGSSECHIPEMVKNRTSWVGVLWQKDKTQCLICRRIPKRSAKQSGDVYFRTGVEIKLPERASELQSDMNIDNAIMKFEALIGIEEIKSNEIEEKKLDSKRVTLRHCVPFLLQDDDTIISKGNLFRGGKEQGKRVSLIDAFPYYLGLIDQAVVRKRTELKLKEQELKRLRDSLEKRNKLLNDDLVLAKSLIDEARSAGFEIENSGDNIDSTVAILTRIKESGINTYDSIPDHDILYDLYDREAQITGEIERTNFELKKLIKFKELASTYTSGKEEYKRRLEAVNLLPDPGSSLQCPLCNSQLETTVKKVEEIKVTLNSISKELSLIEGEVPKVDHRVKELNSKLQDLREQRRSIKGSIVSLSTADSNANASISREEQRQANVIGRISFYLDYVVGEHSKFDKLVLNQLEEEIFQLEDEVGRDAVEEELFTARKQLSKLATEILKALPFDERYRSFDVDFNPTDLSVGIETDYRKVPMRNIGSDENYLSLHVAVIMGLHRFFAHKNLPVPGVVFFDQLSRPYYNSEKENDEVVIEAENDNEHLRRYFEFLFKEVMRGESLQVIILEHAFFKDFEKFVSATKYRWKKIDDGLIPSDWTE